MRFIVILFISFFCFVESFIFISSAQQHASEADPLSSWLETEDFLSDEEIDSTLYSVHHTKKYDLNKINQYQLDSLGVLSAKQIEHFMAYRKTFGPFLDVYELQAIPLWDLFTISRIRKWVTILPLEWYKLSLRAPVAQSILTIRWRPSVLQQADNSIASWRGDAHYWRALYRYSSSLLKFGITAEKDPGEYWLNQRTKLPADFLSAHVAVSGKGLMRQLIIGDFNVNLAQGLIQWQTMNFRKTAQLSLLKKNSSIFQVHRSVNEFNFHRGLALQLQVKNHSLALFASYKTLSANLGYSSASDQSGITSFNMSGYHRTAAEIKSKGAVALIAGGGRYNFKQGMFTGGINFLLYHFSLPLIVTARPYDQFAIAGKKWINASVDLGYTYKNFHLFTEQATDRNGSLAGLAGMLLSLSKTIDVGFVGRFYSSSFQSLYSSAISEGTLPNNERGIFFSVNANLSGKVQVQAFSDYFFFPWLRYLIDQPSGGHEQFIQVNYQPDKGSTIYFRFRQEQKMQTTSDELAASPLAAALLINRAHFRIHVDRAVSKTFKWSLRMETSRVKRLSVPQSMDEFGFLGFIQLGFRPMSGKLKGLFRFLLFDTDGYQSRIYAFSPTLGGGYQLGQYKNSGKELLLTIENHLFRAITVLCSATGVQEASSRAIFWHYSVQIALKFHELAPSKIYKPI